MVASAGIVFIIALIVVSVITMKLADWIIDSRIGALDRTLGFLYGAARGILVVAVALLFFNWLAGEKAPGWVANAKSRPLLESIGAKLESLLPEDPENAILNRLNPNQPAPETDAETPPAADAPATGDETDAPAPDDSGTDAPPADNAPTNPAPAN
jgi:membrane protein required for colicin V production